MYILANVHILEYDQFMAVFTTQGLQARQRHGCRSAQVFTTDDPKQVIVLFDWDSPAAFEGFLNDPRVQETMKSSGTAGRPTFTFMNRTAELPA